MKETQDFYLRNDFRLSPIYEKILIPGGGGFAGFTILYGDDVFRNYVRFFTKDNKAEIMAQVQEKHLQYTNANEENHKNQ